MGAVITEIRHTLHEPAPFSLAKKAKKEVSPRSNGEAPPFPYFVLDGESAELWAQIVKGGTLEHHTLNTIHSISDNQVPLRWITNIIDVAHFVEGAKAHGITPPTKLNLMGLIHINAVANKGDAKLGQRSLEKAQQLREFTHAYLETFHPNVQLETALDFDDPSWISGLIELGRKLYPLLPEEPQQQLANMARKHTTEDGIPVNSLSAAYLIAHYSIYGRFTEDPFGIFPQKNHNIFLVPQSEVRFFNTMSASSEALSSLGLKPREFTQGGNVALVSQALRTAHYYPHMFEPLLSDITEPSGWPTREALLANPEINKAARGDMLLALDVIENDIGGVENAGALIELVEQTLGKAELAA